MKKLTLSLLLVHLLPTCFALTPSSANSIHGNPIQRQDSYTINSHNEGNVTINCQFSNKGSAPALLNIWTSPQQTQPAQKVALKAATTAAYNYSITFTMPLTSAWWCEIYTAHTTPPWKYCAFISISDATISDYHPFATWNSTTHSKKTTYNCSLKSSNPDVKFFYFK